MTQVSSSDDETNRDSASAVDLASVHMVVFSRAHEAVAFHLYLDHHAQRLRANILVRQVLSPPQYMHNFNHTPDPIPASRPFTWLCHVPSATVCARRTGGVGGATYAHRRTARGHRSRPRQSRSFWPGHNRACRAQERSATAGRARGRPATTSCSYGRRASIWRRWSTRSESACGRCAHRAERTTCDHVAPHRLICAGCLDCRPASSRRWPTTMPVARRVLQLAAQQARWQLCSRSCVGTVGVSAGHVP